MRTDRRRFLTIAAAAAGSALIVPSPCAWAAPGDVRQWQGTALGADASLTLCGLDRPAADRLIETCLAEVARLERVFSLHRADSALVHLNRTGRLDAPPADLVRLMQDAVTYGHLTGGAFDITVQPLWELFANHFAKGGSDTNGPPAQTIAALRPLVDFRAVKVEPARIAFARPGMAVTLNGIAQGYITDRITDLLIDAGMRDVLVDMGEIRALGRHPEGRPWRVSIRQGDGSTGRVLDLDGALATSATDGTCFDPAGHFGHVLDPQAGTPVPGPRQVSVRAATACRADALSTAFLLLPPDRVQAVAAALADVSVVLPA